MGKRINLFSNKCLCGCRWAIKDNGVVGEFWCDNCDEFKRFLNDDEYTKYKLLIKKRNAKISDMFK